MTSASSLAFPGSRTLATWWRQLAPCEPQELTVGYLFVHRLEALAGWHQPRPLDPLLLLTLEALILEREEGTCCRRVRKRLNLEIPVIRRLVQSLADLHLIQCPAPSAGREPSWIITDQGLDALRTKKVWSRHWKRATFTFAERLNPVGSRLTAPHYLKVLNAPSCTWLVDEGAAFEISWLRACLDQSTEWKTTFGFSLDVTAFPALVAKSGSAVSSDEVVLDRTERLLVVLFLGPKPKEDFLGFGVRPEGWVLNTTDPIIRLPAAARELFLKPDPLATLDPWREAWRSWCQMRSVPVADVKECSILLLGERLQVAAPERLVHYLQAGKSDVFKGETWILAGEGYLRQAARVELVAVHDKVAADKVAADKVAS